LRLGKRSLRPLLAFAKAAMRVPEILLRNGQAEPQLDLTALERPGEGVADVVFFRSIQPSALGCKWLDKP